jgi:hypothetical protein
MATPDSFQLQESLGVGIINMSNTSILFSIVFILIVLIALFKDQIPKLYKTRNCQGMNWKRKYPKVPKEEIREFLQILIDAFGFKSKHRCKFNPEDKVMDIYSALYPDTFLGKLSGDALEVETFSVMLEEKYHVDFNKIWKEGLTLGQIFNEIQKAKSQQTATCNLAPQDT